MNHEYFNNLSDADKIKVYSSLSTIERRNVVLNNDIETVKNIFFGISADSKFEMLSFMRDGSLLKDLYKNMSFEERKAVESLLDYKKGQLEQNKSNTYDDIINRNSEIVSSHNSIENSKNVIKLSKETIKSNKQQLKIVNVDIKKNDKLVKKTEKKYLKACKVSPFDCIGFVSRYHANKLQNRFNEYTSAAKIQVDLNNKKSNIERTIEGAKDRIEMEKSSIQNAKELIKKDREAIKKDSELIKKLNIQLKVVTKERKEAIRARLINQALHPMDLVVNIQRSKTDEFSRRIDELLFVDDSLSDENVVNYDEEITNTVEEVNESNDNDSRQEEAQESLESDFIDSPEQNVSSLQNEDVDNTYSTIESDALYEMDRFEQYSQQLEEQGISFDANEPISKVQESDLGNPVEVSNNSNIIDMAQWVRAREARKKANQETQSKGVVYSKISGAINIKLLFSILLLLFGFSLIIIGIIKFN